MRQGRYWTAISMEDLAEEGSPSLAHSLIRRVSRDLWRRSGAEHVPATALVVRTEDLSSRSIRLRVVFNSRAWTG